MYTLYNKFQKGSTYKYNFQKRTSLFGCRSGKLISMLKNSINENDSEPLKWRLNIDEMLYEKYNQSLIINLKPNSNNNLSLYEIRNVWGFSSHNWTPIMIHLQGLFVDQISADINDKEFSLRERDIDNPIFSTLYLNGTIFNGQIKGKWVAPRPSPTNSSLLWPDTLEYFFNEAKKIINNN